MTIRELLANKQCELDDDLEVVITRGDRSRVELTVGTYNVKCIRGAVVLELDDIDGQEAK